MFGERLKLARKRAGLSLRDLAARLDGRVSPQAIGKYERGEMAPSSRVLIALADALGMPESFLLSQRDIELERLEFRKKAIVSRREEAQVEAAVLEWLDRYLTVEELLQLPSLEWDRPREAPFPVREVGEAELAARSLRDHWDLGADPIPNLAEFLEERGIKVLAARLDNVHGSACWARRSDGRRVPVIVVNENDTGERQRFSLAHELGHVVTEVAEGVDAEKAAHRFAGAFLMPAEVLWAEVGKHRTSLSLGELFALKRLFGASVPAITYRCRDLGIIGPTTAQALFKRFNRLGWNRPPYPEPEPLPQERPQRFRRLCFRALAEGAISEAKAAELLGISVRELNRAMDEPPEAAA